MTKLLNKITKNQRMYLECILIKACLLWGDIHYLSRFENEMHAYFMLKQFLQSKDHLCKSEVYELLKLFTK